MFPFATKRFIVKMVTRYRTLNFPRIKQWLMMHGSGQFEEMLVAIFRSQKTAVCSRHFKDSDYKTTLTEKRKLNNDAVPSIFVWKKSSCETSKEFAKRPKKKGNEELKTKTEIKTAKDSKLNCNTPFASSSASSREVGERPQVETVTNESLSKLKEINEKLKQELKETCNALDAKTQKMKALESELKRRNSCVD